MLHHTVLPQTRTKPGVTVATAIQPLLKRMPFPSRAGEEQKQSVSGSVPCTRAPHKSPLWKGKAAPLHCRGKKRVLFSLRLKYAVGSVCAETQMHVLCDRLLQQPGQPRLIKDHRFPPRWAPENSASDFYIASKNNNALYNV